MRIALFNVKFSPNLGDGVIAECLEHELRSVLPGATITSLDLAGREAFGQGLDRSRSTALSFLHSLPPGGRRVVVRILLGLMLRLRQRPRWRKALQDCDAAVIGGGQLIADADLNFPLKLAAVGAECRALSVPLAVFGVGVSSSWSALGRRLLRSLFNPAPVLVMVRDERSRDNLVRLLAGTGHPPPALCRDPGLLAASVYPCPERAKNPRPRVGLGITSPSLLRHHTDDPAAKTDAEGPALYRAVALSLARAGYDVLCFTNGASEDEECLAETRAMMQALDPPEGSISYARRPSCPGELAALIAGLDVVVSHRLHASIVAYSYGRPSIGLRWDVKVPAFFASVGREAFVVSSADDLPATLPGLVARALATGIDASEREQVIAETRQRIHALAFSIVARARGAQEGSRAQVSDMQRTPVPHGLQVPSH